MTISAARVNDCGICIMLNRRIHQQCTRTAYDQPPARFRPAPTGQIDPLNEGGLDDGTETMVSEQLVDPPAPEQGDTSWRTFLDHYKD